MKKSIQKHVRIFLLLIQIVYPIYTNAGSMLLPAQEENQRPSSTMQAANAPSIEVGFSPEGGAETLVLKIINAAKSSIRLAGYSFTSPKIMKALVDAKNQGVDVAILVDYNSNCNKKTQNPSLQALNLATQVGIATRTINRYAIHHDKYIIVDGMHVETGSFNFTKAAATRNSENVIVLWNFPLVANKYKEHWQNRWDQGQSYTLCY